MASQPMPGSTDGRPRTPPAPSTPAAPRVSYVQRCVVLVDWWLERVEGEEAKIRVAGNPHTPQMRKGASSSKGNRQGPGRAFRSAAIARRHDYTAIETEDGYIIRIGRLLNIPKSLENGFPEEVCKCFEFGFPIQWLKLLNPNMEQQNEQAQSQSESIANAPRHSVEYCIGKFLRDSCIDPTRYAFTENDFHSSVGYTSNMDEPAIQSLSNSDGNAGEPGTTKCGKASVNLGTTDAFELSTGRITPQFGAVRGSEDSPVRRLRSGKVFGTPSGGPMKNSRKQKKIQHEASSKNMVPNEGGTSTADLTSHENVSSAARIVTEDNQESHDSHSERQERSVKKAKKRKESDKLFWSWV